MYPCVCDPHEKCYGLKDYCKLDAHFTTIYLYSILQTSIFHLLECWSIKCIEKFNTIQFMQ